MNFSPDFTRVPIHENTIKNLRIYAREKNDECIYHITKGKIIQLFLAQMPRNMVLNNAVEDFFNSKK